MIIVTRRGATAGEVDAIRERGERLGLRTYRAKAGGRSVVACVGDPEALDRLAADPLPAVERTHRVPTPYKLAARAFMRGGSRVRVGPWEIGGGDAALIAGPCAVEGPEMLLETAAAVRDAGAHALRGGAYKPRTSPYSFQGLAGEGLAILAEVRSRTGLPVVSEVTDVRRLDDVAAHVDVLQVGARSMYNYELLRELGRMHRPVLLKRGHAATLEEFLLAAEYILAQGNMKVILCERGIRTFENATRNTLDLGAIAVLQRETHLPVIADPSHAAGDRDLVPALGLAALAAGADGLLVEVHPDPDHALSDADQQLDLAGFRDLVHRSGCLLEALGRGLLRSGPRPYRAPKAGWREQATAAIAGGGL